MRSTRVIALSTLILIAGSTAGVVISAGGAPAHLDTGVAAARFDNPKPNRYFPLRPGTVHRYRGTDEGERFRERVAITHHTKTIQGVRTRVVRDVVRRRDGSLAEKTHDWYAADNDGNVWYFGERTATYDEHGNLESREGSWRAGVDGAVAGMIMSAGPHVTDAYRQEFYQAHAEDQAWIVQTHTAASTPYGSFDDVVRSFEWTRLERGVISMKLYAPGLGLVEEKDVRGGNEHFELVAVTHR